MRNTYNTPEIEITELFTSDILLVSGELASDNEVDIDGDDLYNKG